MKLSRAILEGNGLDKPTNSCRRGRALASDTGYYLSVTCEERMWDHLTSRYSEESARQGIDIFMPALPSSTINVDAVEQY